MGGVFDLFDFVHEKEVKHTSSLAVQLQPVQRIRCVTEKEGVDFWRRIFNLSLRMKRYRIVISTGERES